MTRRPSVVILIGLPGSGKSTYITNYGAQMLERSMRGEEDYQDIRSCSADDYFMERGVYKFDPSKLPEAHGRCLRQFAALVQSEFDSDIVYVDNTNTTIAEIAPYAALALAYGCLLHLVYIKCDPKVAAARNIHGVPENAIMKMQERINKTLSELPRRWNLTTIDAE